jgi:hypothetical protein
MATLADFSERVRLTSKPALSSLTLSVNKAFLDPQSRFATPQTDESSSFHARRPTLFSSSGRVPSGYFNSIRTALSSS